MKYKNEETGIVIDVNSKLTGKWKKLEDKKETKSATPKKTKKEA